MPSNLTLTKHNPLRVLLVDDDLEFSSLMASRLEAEFGARVHCVSSAYAAMNELLDSYYGLVILDWNLAGHSGLQALKDVDKAMGLEDRIPLRGVESRIPVVVLSAQDPEKLHVLTREKKHFVIKRVLSKKHGIDQIVEMINPQHFQTAV